MLKAQGDGNKLIIYCDIPYLIPYVGLNQSITQTLP